jgi:Domain of unknown function (DUF1905)
LKSETNLSGKIKYEFSEKSWQHASPGGWYFVSLPKKMSKEIRGMLKSQEEGWGRLKAVAKIGNIEWKTAIWFDSKNETYLLPLKAEIRKKENIQVDKQIEVILWL